MRRLLRWLKRLFGRAGREVAGGIALSNGTASGLVIPLMDRGTFIGTLTGGLLAAPLAAKGQQARIPRIGILTTASPGSSPPSAADDLPGAPADVPRVSRFA